MARLTIYIIALALGAAAAVGLVSCGGSNDDLLPGKSANEILDNLNTIDQLVAEGDCTSAAAAAQEVRDQVEGLPRTVDAELRQRLAEGADNLEQLAASDCEEPTTVTTTTEESTKETTATQEEPTTETTNTETETTNTETGTTDTEPPPTATSTTTTPTGGSGGVTPGGPFGGGGSG